MATTTFSGPVVSTAGFQGNITGNVSGEVNASSLTVGASGTAVTQIRMYSPSLSPAQVANNTSAEQTFTVNGLTTADRVLVIKPTAQAGLGIVGARVSAANTLAITFANLTATPITPTASESYQVVAIRA